VVVAVGSHLFYFDITEGSLDQRATTQLAYEVSSISVHPLGQDETASSNVCAVGLWTEMSIHLLRLPDLEPVGLVEPVGLDNDMYLTCACGVCLRVRTCVACQGGHWWRCNSTLIAVDNVRGSQLPVLWLGRWSLAVIRTECRMCCIGIEQPR
jgi:hypothetical protein